MNLKAIYRAPLNAIKVRGEPDYEDMEGTAHDLEETQSHVTLGALASVDLVKLVPSLEDIVKCHNKKELWYPWAKRVPAIKHQGTYNGGYPVGGIYHYNAGGNDPVSTMNTGRKNNYLYSACGRDGLFVQSNPLSQWGYHAGKSQAKIGGKLRSGVSAFLHGVEVSAAGTVTPKSNGKYAAYFHKSESQYFSEAEVRKAGPIPGQLRGSAYFHKYDPRQELAMERFWIWCKVNSPNVFQLEQIYGHDEVAVEFGRKVDPGGCLSVPMKEYREKLLKIYDSLGLPKR